MNGKPKRFDWTERNLESTILWKKMAVISQWIPLLEWLSPFVTFFLAWSKKESKGQKQKKNISFATTSIFSKFWLHSYFLCSFYEICNPLFSSFLQRSINEKYNCSSKYNFSAFRIDAYSLDCLFLLFRRSARYCTLCRTP